MKKYYIILTLIITASISYSQVIHTIKADSVLLHNPGMSTELNLENGSRHVKGGLYNRHNGRTEFSRIAKLDDSLVVIGGDTIKITGISNWKKAGNLYTNPVIDFAGTKDLQAFILKTNQAPRLSLSTGGIVGIGNISGYTTDNLQVAGSYAQSGSSFLLNNLPLGGSASEAYVSSSGTHLIKINQWSYCSFIGYSAGGNNSIFGVSNTGLGYATLSNSGSISQNNSALGANVLKNLTTSSVNDAMGSNAGYNITTGVSNSIMGAFAGMSLTTQSCNTLMGTVAFQGIDASSLAIGGPVGANNIALGYNAGGSGKTIAQWSTVTTSNNNIFIGSSNGKSTAGGTLAGTTLLGSDVITDLNNILVLGRHDQNVILTNSNSISGVSDAKLQIDAAQGYQLLQIVKPYTPTSSADPNGAVGAIAWDNNYVYLKTPTGWVRMSLSSF